MSQNNKIKLAKEITSQNIESILPNVFEKIIPITQNITIIDNEKNEEITSESNGDEDDSDDDNIDEEDFTCELCNTIQCPNNCELCDVENICEECFGQGGDYGPNEIWVCHECLPTCNECNAKLYSAVDECCGKGRSDLYEKEDSDIE